MKVSFVNDSCERLGVEYISSLLKSGGHEVKLFADPQLFDDENLSFKRLSRLFDYKKRVISQLKEYKPDLVGISVVTDFYQWACQMAKMIKEEMDVPIIFGGIHPTSVPERVIKNDFVDMVCVGEGEYPMLELANSMEKGQIDYSIKNIWFKKNGQVIQNEVRPLIENLDSLPMPDKDLYYSASPHFSQCYYIMTSRGCAYACSYCCHSYLREIYKTQRRYVRRRSVMNTIQELMISKQKYKLKYLRFFDESLGADLKWLQEFSIQYKKNITLPFICYMHPNHVSLESVRYLKDCGCCEIEMGIQSGSDSLRRVVLNRDMSNKTIAEAIDLIRNEKISLVTDNIFGLPGEDQNDIIDLARFYNIKRVNRIYFFWLRFYPKIAITEWAREQRLLNIADYEEIMNGERNRPFARGGDRVNRNLVKLQFLFLIIPFLPKFIVRFIIKSRIYQYLPMVDSPGILAAFTSLFSTSFNDRIVHKKEFLRYSNTLKTFVLQIFRN